MFFIERISRKSFPALNQRVHTWIDFLSLCQRQGVKVFEANTGHLGLYLLYKGVPVIVLDPGLSGGLKLWVAMHEFAHHLLHAPNASAFSISMKRKADLEANIVAGLLLVPLTLVKTALPGEIQEEFDYPRELLDFRKEVYEWFRK